MRTLSFRHVLRGILAKDGVPAEYIDTYGAGLGPLISDRVREAWEHDYWPELTRIDQRWYRADYAGGTAYATGDFVYDPTGDKYYKAVAGSTGQALSNTTYWTPEFTGFDRYVALVQAGKTTIGSPLAIYSKNPRTSDSPGRMNFELSDNGVQVSSLAGNSVWLEYRTAPTRFGTDEWSSSTTYAVGDLIYHDATAECYISIQAGSNQTPPAGAYWTKLDFPYIFERWTVQACYADLLASDGQTAKSISELQKADDLLGDLSTKESPQTQWPRIQVARVS
tara:strand:- start:20791 stop:21630 length:840 start_codon:yes stop_codon:yes gene_type:complete